MGSFLCSPCVRGWGEGGVVVVAAPCSVAVHVGNFFGLRSGDDVAASGDVCSGSIGFETLFRTSFKAVDTLMSSLSALRRSYASVSDLTASRGSDSTSTVFTPSSCAAPISWLSALRNRSHCASLALDIWSASLTYMWCFRM